jgi:predicted nucleic acid-binding protein
VYDSMYVALAVRLSTRAITADDRLEAALKRIPAVAGHIQLVSDVRA